MDDLDAPVTPRLDAILERLGVPTIDLVLFHAVPELDTRTRLATSTAPAG